MICTPPERQKGYQKELKSDEKKGLKAFCGTCWNHGIYYAGGTWGGLMESPETTFLAIAARRARRKVLQRCADGLFAIFEDSRGSLGKHFSLKNPICFLGLEKH